MDDVQYYEMMKVLNEINAGIKNITSKSAAKDTFNLNDVYDELTTISSNVSSVESAVNDVTAAVNNIKLE